MDFKVSTAVFTTLLHLPRAMSSGHLSSVLLITSALLHLPLASCHLSLSGSGLSTSLVFTTTLLHLPAMTSGHPCLSEAGLTSAICSRLIQHCSSPLGSKTAACQGLLAAEGEGDRGLDKYLSHTGQVNLEKVDLGINILDPTLDKLLDIDTSIIDDNFYTEDILFTLLSIPSDLWGFYTQFAIGVRRGLSSILSSIGLSDLVTKPDKPGLTKPSYIAPTFNNNYNPPGFSLKASDIVDYIRQKKKTEVFDDPNSPYSVNYKGPSAGYNVQFSGEAPYQSGYFSLKTPSHSHSQSWGSQSSSILGGRNDLKDPSAPILPAGHSYETSEIWNDSGSYNVEYDKHGNLLFTDINKLRRNGDKREDDIGNLNFENDNSISKAEVEEGAALPRIKVKKAPPALSVVRNPTRHYNTTRREQPWTKKQTLQKYGKRKRRDKIGSRGSRLKTRRKPLPAIQNRGKVREDKRRRVGSGKKGNGGRRFDRIAPNSDERKDVKIVKGEVPNKDYYFVDYLYYD